MWGERGSIYKEKKESWTPFDFLDSIDNRMNLDNPREILSLNILTFSRLQIHILLNVTSNEVYVGEIGSRIFSLDIAMTILRHNI